jgi:thiol-disulfide isomerase/thioredoxin
MHRGPGTLVPFLLALLSPVPHSRGADGLEAVTPALRWMTAAGTAWETTPSDPGADAAVVQLEAPPWFPVLPDLEIPLLDGGVVDLGSARGRVVLLDFWASWCTPCLEELPHLQELYARESNRGLVAVAVNARESEEVARTTARALKLTLPIGQLTKALNRQLEIKSLPSIVIADREGRIRARWDGYMKGLEATVSEQVAELLQNEAIGRPIPIAQLLVGAGRLEVRWRREVGAQARGLGLIRSADGSSRIYLSEPGRIWTLGADGRILKQFTSPLPSARLVQGDLDDDGGEELVAYQPGSERLALIDPEAARDRQWDAPAPVSGVTVIRSSEGQTQGLALATSAGLFIGVAGDGAPRQVGPQGPQKAVAAPVGGAALAALSADGTVAWYGADGTEAARANAGNAWALVTDRVAEGVGVLRMGTIAAAAGNFLGAGGREVAVATVEGELLLLDIASGAIRVRARWPGITDLMGRDLDGDGVDELFVAENRALTVLAAP